MAPRLKGTFITFEGSEGSGKSTQAAMLVRYLKSKKKKVLYIREPGGIKVSEDIRRILLNVKNTGMSMMCEMLLYMAARAELTESVIIPALKKGTIVISDRYLDSTIAYQGYGCGLDIPCIKQVGRYATSGITPDLTFVFDIETKKGLSRTGKTKDRIERRSLQYHKRVRAGYRAIARKEPKRVVIVKVNTGKSEIQQYIQSVVARKLKI